LIVPFYQFIDISKVLDAFKRAMSYHFNNPRYMPVSRELSNKEVEMIRNWLQRPIYNKKNISKDTLPEIKSVQELKEKL